MKIGYPCINLSLECRSSRTFRLASYSEGRFAATLAANLDCLARIFRYNAQHGLQYFRISSGLVPFASHPVCSYPWVERFGPVLRELGSLARAGAFRLAMHPDQFVLLNAPNEDLMARSVAELGYHAAVLDAMEMDLTHKVQIHVGGLYADRAESLRRFIDRYRHLPEAVRRRLVIENDDRLFPLSDCLRIHEETGVPVVFDNLHYSILNDGTPVRDALRRWTGTWREEDGTPLMDYSSQEPGERLGKHADTLDGGDFARFLQETAGFDFDLMLEIKDKERSAHRAAELARRAGRLKQPAIA